MLIDSHAHLVSLENLSDVLHRAKESQIGKILSISSDLPSSHDTIKLANEIESVYASVGIHPHAASSYTPEIILEIEELTKVAKVVAIGETGLDYFYMNSEKEVQITSFKEQIKLAKRCNLPIIIHVREADEDLISILKSGDVSDRTGVIHCFTGNYETAAQYLDMGFYISFSGILTFKRSEELREAAKNIPADKILIETDSPYLAPVPHRGKPNEPSYVKFVAQTLADVRGTSIEEIAQLTAVNAETLFQLKHRQ